MALRVGGPAADVGWAQQFVDLVAGQSLPADFVSLHIYGNQSTGAEFQANLGSIQQEITNTHLSLPISVTEWGPHTDSELNFEPIAGAFVLDFASTVARAGVSDAIFLALSQFPANNWPVLYTTDQTPTDIMVAFQALAGLQGTQGSCTGSAELSCIAATGTDGTINLVFWSFSWAGVYFPDSMTPTSNAYEITVQPGAGTATSYAIQSAKLDSGTWDLTASPISVSMSGTSIQVGLQVPYASYGEITLRPD
jgi:hypothetical protein